MRAAKVDALHTAIMDAIECAGWSCFSTAKVGNDAPDIVAAKGKLGVLFEVKSRGKTQTDGQREFERRWRGAYYVVYTVDEVLKVLKRLDVTP